MSTMVQLAEATSGARLTLPETEHSLPECFERQAEFHRSHRAIGCGAWQPNYEELNNAANHVAHALLQHVGKPGDRVAVMMRQDGGPVIAGVLGVLKAGRIVVVLNPLDPPERQEQMITDAEPSSVLADASNLERARRICGKKCVCICFENHFATSPSPNPGIYAAPNEVARLTYTSGSTGRPKGVMGTHRTVLHHVYRCSDSMKICAEDRIAALSSLSGGQGLGLTWCALLNGATAFPFPISADELSGLASWVIENRITILASATSVLRHLIQMRPPGLSFPHVRLVRIGSEATWSDDLAAFRNCFPKECVLMHAYSTTESGNISQRTFHCDEDVATGLLPAGRPVEGIAVSVVDEAGGELPRGETGDIIARSQYLSPGYWRDEVLTTQCFLAAPEGLRRSFRTGDRGWLTLDGQLVVTGRKSGHVNILGHSVELYEIESALLRLKEVAGALVLASSSASGREQIIAFVTLRASHSIGSDGLREALYKALPAHMIPAAIMILPSFPLASSGKPDRQKLLGTFLESRDHTSYKATAPANDMEELLAAIWAGVLNRDRVACDADFFQLGGDSLAAAAIAAKLHAILGVELDMRAFALHRTVVAMSRLVNTLRESSQPGNHVPLIPVSRDTPLRASFSQERIWRYSQTPEGAAGYTRTSVDRVRGPLDLAALQQSVDHLVRRHEILRCSFAENDGKLFQIVHPASSFPLLVTDLTAVAEPEMAAQDELEKERLVPFDLKTGSLFRLRLLRLRKDEHWLVRSCDYIIADGGSWRIFFMELMALYESYLRGETPGPSPGGNLQYADFAAWQRRRFEADTSDHAEEIKWWKESLHGVSPLTSPPFLRPAPEHAALASEGKIAWDLGRDASRQLDALGRRAGATYFSTRLALFSACLSLKSGHPDILLGTYATNRLRPELQQMLGCFVNLTTLRLPFDGRLSFREWLPQVSRIVADSQAHAAIPYEKLREDLGKENLHLPEVKMIFGMSDEKPAQRTTDLEISRVRLPTRVETMPWGFTISLEPMNDTHSWLTTFDARIYDPVAVFEFIGNLQQIATEIGREPERPLAELAQCCP